MKFSSALRGGLAAGCLVAGAGLVERIADPFERFEHDYTLEGPQHMTEVFYVSSNWYNGDGEKHDDRVGDILLTLSGACALGYVALTLREGQKQTAVAAA